MYFAINYLSSNQQSTVTPKIPDVLGAQVTTSFINNIYQQLPPDSRNTLENLSTSPAAKLVQEKLDYLKSQSTDFPQKQIGEIQKSIIKTVLKNYLNTLETKP